jgi:glutathione-regulated potassium-efflux system ancillary protein KefF
MIVVLHAHPYPDRSRANRILARAVEDLPGVVVRPLYDLYPDFAIDVEAEQRIAAAADVLVFQHPLYWYMPPALLKLWFEQVLEPGWAYGPDGDALRGKRCLWVVTTGGDDGDYASEGMHGHDFDTFTSAVRQTARFCGMRWLDPLVVHAAARVDDERLRDWGERYRDRLLALGAGAEARHA